jgi:hypothetical protein
MSGLHLYWIIPARNGYSEYTPRRHQVYAVLSRTKQLPNQAVAIASAFGASRTSLINLKLNFLGFSSFLVSLYLANMNEAKVQPFEMAEVKAVQEKKLQEESQSSDSSQQSHADATSNMSGWEIFLVWFAIALSSLCVFLDEGIIATAIPRITDQFHSLTNVGVCSKVLVFELMVATAKKCSLTVVRFRIQHYALLISVDLRPLVQ